MLDELFASGSFKPRPTTSAPTGIRIQQHVISCAGIDHRPNQYLDRHRQREHFRTT
jgi:hypothetical protein